MEKKLNIQQLEKKNIFKTPERYFESLSFHIQQRILLNKSWLTELPKNDSIFQVPENYFDSLRKKIIEKTAIESDSFLGRLPKEQVFKIPQNYFENLNEQIFQKTTFSTEHTLEQIGRESIFQVPENYFDSLSSNILKRIEERPVLFIGRTIWRYGMVASVLLCMLMAYWLIPQRTETNEKLDNGMYSYKPPVFKEATPLPTQKDKKVLDEEIKMIQVENQSPVKEMVVKKQNFEFNLTKELDLISKEDMLAYFDSTEVSNFDLKHLPLTEQEAIAGFLSDDSFNDEFLLDQLSVEDIHEILVDIKLKKK